MQGRLQFFCCLFLCQKLFAKHSIVYKYIDRYTLVSDVVLFCLKIYVGYLSFYLLFLLNANLRAGFMYVCFGIFAKANSTSLHFLKTLAAFLRYCYKILIMIKLVVCFCLFASTFCFDIVYISTFRDEHIL